MNLDELKDYLNNDPGFFVHNHMRYTVVEEGYCECCVDLTADSLNPQRVAHGSLLFTMCDVVTGVAAASLGKNMLTQAADIHYIRTATTGTLTAKSRLIKSGRHTALCAAEVYDDQGRLLCTGNFEIFHTGGEVTWMKDNGYKAD